jgi:hypothetical protein
MRARLLTLATLVPACSAPPECASFEHIRVTDPHGAATPWALDEVHRALDDFRRWTGRSGVCVSEVQLLSVLEATEDGGQPAGRYLGDVVEIDVGGAVHFVTIHELCHAVDVGVEQFSRDHPWLFHPGLGLQPSAESSPSEVYATTCDDGPHALELAVEASCGDVPRTEFVLQHTYFGAWERGYTWSSGVPLDRRPVDLPPDGYVGSTVAGPAGLYVSREEPVPDGRAVSVVWAGPGGGGVIDGPTVGPDADWFLVGGDEDPLLLVHDPDAGFLVGWKVDAAAQQLVSFDVSSALAQVDADEVTLARGGAWGWTELPNGDRAWRRVALDDDVITLWPPPDGARGGPPMAVPGAVVSVGIGADGEDVLVRWDLDAERWSVIPVPEAFTPVDAAGLADGRVAVRWVGGRDAGPLGFAWVDPDTGAWTVVREPCDTGRSRTSGTLGSVDGDVMFLEYPDPELGTGFDVAVLTPP